LDTCLYISQVFIGLEGFIYPFQQELSVSQTSLAKFLRVIQSLINLHVPVIRTPGSACVLVAVTALAQGLLVG